MNGKARVMSGTQRNAPAVLRASLSEEKFNVQLSIQVSHDPAVGSKPERRREGRASHPSRHDPTV